MTEIKNQFKQFIDNQINNSGFLFRKYDEITFCEEGIFLVVISGNESYTFSYNPVYQSDVDHTCYYEFDLMM